MYKMDIKKQVFSNISKKTEEILIKDHLINNEIEVLNVSDGIVLPEVGILSSDGDFITSFRRDYGVSEENNLSQVYKTRGSLLRRTETVIFGGVLFDHFGHILRDFCARLWYFVKNPDMNYKIIFLKFGNKNYSDLVVEILLMLGICKEQYEIIDAPTQFNDIIVPEQSTYVTGGYRNECKLVFDKIISHIKPSLEKKIYISRSKFGGSINESYFENFYSKRGFKIVFPERLSFLEQVSLVHGADEIVCSTGTLVHLTYFAKENARVTIFYRNYNSLEHQALESWVFSLQMRKLEVYFVNTSYEFLPIHFNIHTGLYGPTKYWREYLDACNIEYSPEEISFDIHVKPYVYDYVIDWAEKCNNARSYSFIKQNNLVDVVALIHSNFLDENINIDKILFKESISPVIGNNYQRGGGFYFLVLENIVT